MKPFDYINDINYGKKNVIENSDNPELAEKLYVPFITNKTLSYFIDCIGLVNEVNIRPNMQKKPQFDFLINTIRQKKRFTKWIKKVDDDKLNVIMSHYGYSYEKAKQVSNFFDEDKIKKIDRRNFEGGLNDRKHDRSKAN